MNPTWISNLARGIPENNNPGLLREVVTEVELDLRSPYRYLFHRTVDLRFTVTVVPPPKIHGLWNEYLELLLGEGWTLIVGEKTRGYVRWEPEHRSPTRYVWELMCLVWGEEKLHERGFHSSQAWHLWHWYEWKKSRLVR